MRSLRADRLSRDIFFVAAARSLGISARIDRVTGDVLYQKDSKEIAADFDGGSNEEIRTGSLKLDYAPIQRLDDPEYFRHFTLSKFDGQSFCLLNYVCSIILISRSGAICSVILRR